MRRQKATRLLNSYNAEKKKHDSTFAPTQMSHTWTRVQIHPSYFRIFRVTNASIGNSVSRIDCAVFQGVEGTISEIRSFIEMERAVQLRTTLRKEGS